MGKLDPAAATRFIRGLFGPKLGLRYTRHALDRMEMRGLIVSDLLHVIRHGFVYDEAQESTRDGLYKYRMECVTPNSGGRTVRIVVIPSESGWIKVITVMWADESS
jgi:hypothetical protein